MHQNRKLNAEKEVGHTPLWHFITFPMIDWAVADVESSIIAIAHQLGIESGRRHKPRRCNAPIVIDDMSHRIEIIKTQSIRSIRKWRIRIFFNSILRESTIKPRHVRARIADSIWICWWVCSSFPLKLPARMLDFRHNNVQLFHSPLIFTLPVRLFLWYEQNAIK